MLSEGFNLFPSEYRVGWIVFIGARIHVRYIMYILLTPPELELIRIKPYNGYIKASLVGYQMHAFEGK